MQPLLETTERGLYCRAGDFFVDPWLPVERAVITHAHSDHARPGSTNYLCAAPGAGLLRARLGDEGTIQSLAYGEAITLDGVRLSLHPAGHLLGSAQVRIEQAGQVCVVSGDYKTQPDPTCQPLEPLRCDMFVSESTFGLPIFRWRAPHEIFAEINDWWRANEERGRTSILFAYSLGKSQRILAGVDPSIGPILVHGAIMRFLPAYEAAGIRLAPSEHAGEANSKAARGKALVIAPPSAAATPWLRKFGEASTAMASGWMQIRGARRRRSVDRGFVLSDHADWNGLVDTIAATGAETVWVTHGYTVEMVRWLKEHGRQAVAVATQFEGETDEPEVAAPEAVPEAAATAEPESSGNQSLFPM